MSDEYSEIITTDGVVITTLSDLKAHLHSEHGVTVDEDDPVMLVHTINQLHITATEQTLKRHNTALTEALTVAVKGLTADAITQNLQEQVRLADRTHQEFERQYRRAKLLSVINLICFSACLLVFAYLIS